MCRAAAPFSRGIAARAVLPCRGQLQRGALMSVTEQHDPRRQPADNVRAPLAERVMEPFLDFAHRESTSGLLLLGCTAVALAWANSPWAQTYVDVWQTPFTVGAGSFVISESLHH